MSKLELVFFTNAEGGTRSNKGGTVPPWYNNENTYSTWYSSPQVSFFHNQKFGTPNVMYIQYGRNSQGWGSGRFFVQELEVVSEVENTNGSITVKVRSRLRRFRQRKTSTTSQGFDVVYTIKILGNTVYTYRGTASDTVNEGASAWYTQNFTIDPQDTVQESGIYFGVHYPNGEANDRNIMLGFGLKNTNPISYKPMAVRKSNWLSLDKNNGKISKRKGEKWIDVSLEDYTTINSVNTGKNRIRKSGRWRQLPPM